MDARTGLVIGGMTTVAASVAVVCAVALTNAVALADSPGSDFVTARVLVPAAATPSSDTVPHEADVPDQPEVVEAPTPAVVDDTSAAPPATPAAPAAPDPAAPAAPAGPAAAESSPGAAAAVEASQKAGTWDALRSWALAHGLSQERIDAWIARLEEARGANPGQEQLDDNQQDRTEQGASDAGLVPPAPLPAPERPANAGSTADRDGSSDSSRGGAKKDRSRDSPDSRDR